MAQGARHGLVAITDHDSIDGASSCSTRVRTRDDVIVGEEVSCRLPDGDIEVHLGVYGMTEALHRELQPLRRNVFDVIGALREADVFFALNHLLHFYRGQMPLERYLRLLDEVPALEVRNGTMLAAHNALVERIAAQWPRAVADASHWRRRRQRRAHAATRRHDMDRGARADRARSFSTSLRRGSGALAGAHGERRRGRRRRLRRHRAVYRGLAGFGPRDLRRGGAPPAWRFRACRCRFSSCRSLIARGAARSRERRGACDSASIALAHVGSLTRPSLAPAFAGGSRSHE